ncbi:hypothetical protein WN943_023914 [Citrus x changshan-huyou]
MENGHGGNLADKFSGLALNDKGNDSNNNSNSNNNNNDSLFQVMKAVEAAEATIKQQKLEESIGRRHNIDTWKESFRGPYEVHQSLPSVNNLEDRIKSMGYASADDPSSSLVLHQDLKPTDENAALQSRSDVHTESNKNNGTLKVLSGGQAHADTPGPSQLSSPSTTSFSPSRYQMDGDYDPRFNLSGQGLMPMAEVNNPRSLWKQDLILKIREHEEEIMQLRKHLSEYSIKEAQIRNEKYVLEKRIAYMRLAFDQQQQDLVDAASKALSYRQDIIEENIHLTYQLQAAQQERTTFVQSLLPLLAEYSLQPPVVDAYSIVSNVKQFAIIDPQFGIRNFPALVRFAFRIEAKSSLRRRVPSSYIREIAMKIITGLREVVLFKHLQEKLLLTESKLKESQYQLAPWRSDMNHSNAAPQSPSHSTTAAMDTSNKMGLELVAQPTYSHGKIPANSETQATTDWDLLGHHQGELGGIGKTLVDDMRRHSPLASRDSATQDIPAQLIGTRDDVHASEYGEETANKQVKFRVPVSNSEMDEPDAVENQNERDHSSNWASGNSAYTTTLDDPNSSYSPYLPPVLEEPSSSFSEAADDDPLPAIEGLQISGEAFPGRQLQACGYSINGTTSCNFEWVRHLEDGSVNYIEGTLLIVIYDIFLSLLFLLLSQNLRLKLFILTGAKQPNYLITADDVDTYLAIEVQPLDDRKRKLLCTTCTTTLKPQNSEEKGDLKFLHLSCTSYTKE